MHKRERVGAMERCVRCGQLWPCQSAPKVIVVLIEERGRTPEDPEWITRPEMSRVYTHTDAGRVAAREYGMSLDAHAYSYDIATRVVE